MFKKRYKSDKGDAHVVSFLFIIIIIMALLITIIDIGVFYMNRNVLTNSAQNGARIVSVLGGSGNTHIAEQYGVTSFGGACVAVASNAVECSVFDGLQESNSIIAVTITNITCGPGQTMNIGERTFCQIDWIYHGVPGSMLTHFLNSEQTTRMTAESEVVWRD